MNNILSTIEMIFEDDINRIIIRAIKANSSHQHKDLVLEETEKLVDCFNLEPTLLKLLKEAKSV